MSPPKIRRHRGHHQRRRRPIRQLLYLLLLCGCCQVDTDCPFEVVQRESLCRVGALPEWQQTACDEQWVACAGTALLSSPMTRCQAVQVALSNNRPLQADFERIGIAGSDLFQASLLTNPTLSLTWAFPRAGNNIEGAALFALSDLWQLPLRRRIASTDLQIALLELTDRVLETAFEAKVRYDDELLAMKELELSREIAEESAAYAFNLDYRKEFGLSSDLDISMAQVVTGKMWIEALAKEKMLKMATQELRFVLGMTETCVSIQLADLLIPPSCVLPSLDDLICIAVRCSPALHAQRLRVRRERERIELERRRILRQVDVGIGYIEEPDTGSGLGPAIALEIPLFDQNQAQVARSSYRWREESGNFCAQEQWLVKAVTEAHQRYLTAQEQIARFCLEVLPSLDQEMSYAEEYTTSHQIPHIVLIETRRSAAEGKMVYWQLVYQARIALAELERLIGMRLCEE